MSIETDVTSVAGEVSTWATWLGSLAKVVASAPPFTPTTGTSQTITTTSSTSTISATTSVLSTAATAATAAVSLGIIPAVDDGLKLGTAITNLVAQRDKELNSPAEIQAANAQKLQALKDHIAAVLNHAELTGDLTGVELLLS